MGKYREDFDHRVRAGQKKASGGKVMCDVCYQMKGNCKEIGGRMICGKCRYDHAHKQESADNEQGREFMVSIKLHQLAGDPLALAMVLMKAGISLPRWKELNEGTDRKAYLEAIDLLWTTMFDMGLFGEGAAKMDPRRKR
jgi:hypothetical protein